MLHYKCQHGIQKGEPSLTTGGMKIGETTMEIST